jgi:hypothetical protein
VLQLLLVELGVAAESVENKGNQEQSEQGDRERVLVQHQDQPTPLDRPRGVLGVSLVAGVGVDLVAVGLLGLRRSLLDQQRVSTT